MKIIFYSLCAIFFISCGSNSENIQVKLCGQYDGEFKNETIKLIIEEEDIIDNSNKIVLGYTVHRSNTVMLSGKIVKDSTSNSLKYEFNEVYDKHGSGTFSGIITIDPQIQFTGKYVFPNGKSFPCNFKQVN